MLDLREKQEVVVLYALWREVWQSAGFCRQSVGFFFGTWCWQEEERVDSGMPAMRLKMDRQKRRCAVNACRERSAVQVLCPQPSASSQWGGWKGRGQAGREVAG